jgi:hypothetical protein
MPQEKTPPTMLCPACKTRMSTRQIATASFNKFVYHCPMCDTEIKQEGSFFGGHHSTQAPRLDSVHPDAYLHAGSNWRTRRQYERPED